MTVHRVGTTHINYLHLMISQGLLVPYWHQILGLSEILSRRTYQFAGI
jgi:hypothetical protein